MTKVKTLEFWLFALPVLPVLAWVVGFHHDAISEYLFPAFLGIWLLLAIFWMLRELVRRLRD